MAGRVMVVDDSQFNRHLLSQLLKFLGLEILEADSGRTALDLVARESIDLMLLDINMPDLDGFDVLREVKARAELSHIPIVMVTALEDTEAAVRCLEMGAEDYVNKPYEPTILRARIKACIDKKLKRDQERETIRSLTSLKQDLAQRNEELLATNRKLSEMALIDPLTGAPNRRFALEILERLWANAERAKRHLCCILVGIDQVGQINNTFGNEGGDRVLALAAKLMLENARAGDWVCRLGGTRFLILCCDIRGEESLALGERLRVLLGKELQQRFSQPITVSMGVAEKVAAMPSAADLVNAADDALEQAKEQGRNQSVLHPSASAPPPN